MSDKLSVRDFKPVGFRCGDSDHPSSRHAYFLVNAADEYIHPDFVLERLAALEAERDGLLADRAQMVAHAERELAEKFAYRDERDALLARVARLEGALTGIRRKILRPGRGVYIGKGYTVADLHRDIESATGLDAVTGEVW